MSFQFYANVIGFMKDNMIGTLVASRLRLISAELFLWVQFTRITSCRSSCTAWKTYLGKIQKRFLEISFNPDTILIIGVKSKIFSFLVVVVVVLIDYDSLTKGISLLML